ncbi:hypothetical protein C2R57_03395 [Helicobacter pylori]|nr:hypothetical protein C2R57_03395 [Helicobacter pylori]
MGVLFQNTPLRVLQPNPKRSHQATKSPSLSLSLIKTNFKTFLIIENGSKIPQKPFFFFFETTKHQISAKILSIHATLTKSCDKILFF